MQMDKAARKSSLIVGPTKVITKNQVEMATSRSATQTRIEMEKIEVALEEAKKVAILDEIVAWATTAVMASLTIGGNSMGEAVAITTMMSVK